ncbi:MarR family winged helix-turn-helix transcriptional regulator [Mucilaginibacter lacusdianchii]|uniref:MarR family winged helix-turn-helix transcriptional regulator n=1 Tax=Mucilaginibacter lacusdianchii TaxID=2684211 RepID=UPI00131E2BE5|nr:MarR family transcriptional regulator [Mucilaginibacter sp. JXJ CY 39]
MKKCNINKDLLLFKIFDIHKIICNKANKTLSKEGLQIQVEQAPVLMVAYYNGPQSQQEIADELMRDKSSVLRTVNYLEKAGYVKIELDSNDKRKKLVMLTEAGTSLAERMAQEAYNVDDKMFANLSTAEKLILTELLDKVTTNITNTENIF